MAADATQLPGGRAAPRRWSVGSRGLRFLRHPGLARPSYMKVIGFGPGR
jgi:hypothetical protein